MRFHHQNSQTNLELCDHIKATLFNDILKLVKEAIDFSSIKRNLKLVMTWLVYVILPFTSQYLRIEFYCSLTKNFDLVVLNL